MLESRFIKSLLWHRYSPCWCWSRSLDVVTHRVDVGVALVTSLLTVLMLESRFIRSLSWHRYSPCWCWSHALTGRSRDIVTHRVDVGVTLYQVALVTWLLTVLMLESRFIRSLSWHRYSPCWCWSRSRDVVTHRVDVGVALVTSLLIVLMLESRFIRSLSWHRYSPCWCWSHALSGRSCDIVTHRVDVGVTLYQVALVTSLLIVLMLESRFIRSLSWHCYSPCWCWSHALSGRSCDIVTHRVDVGVTLYQVALVTSLLTVLMLESRLIRSLSWHCYSPCWCWSHALSGRSCDIVTHRVDVGVALYQVALVTSLLTVLMLESRFIRSLLCRCISSFISSSSIVFSFSTSDSCSSAIERASCSESAFVNASCSCAAIESLQKNT